MDKKLEDLAEKIYSEVYGDIDDRRHKDEKTTEIYDWLSTGDVTPEDLDNLPALVAEWREYDSE